MLNEYQLFTEQPLLAAATAGFAGGLLRGALESPAELIKTKLQIGSPWSPSSLLVGLGPTCLRTGCVISCYWVIFEATRPWRDGLPPILANFAGGGLCSVGAWSLVFPLDTAKSRIQAGSRSKGVCDELARIYRFEGVRGWYSGLAPGLFRAFIANGGGMVAYGYMQGKLDVAALSKKSNAPSNAWFRRVHQGGEGRIMKLGVPQMRRRVE